jgi:site-specific DNA-methyltransferase (adenine-specific)
MTKSLDNLYKIDLEKDELNSFDAVIINTSFSIEAFGSPSIIDLKSEFIKTTQSLIEKSIPLLKDGGLLFVYGLPNYLGVIGDFITNHKEEDYSYLFKYWIACEFSIGKFNAKSIPSAHVGLLMYLKSKAKKSPTPFELNTKYLRTPFTICPSCKHDTKDWGGKKHLRNPIGTALSDVWDFNHVNLKNDEIPNIILERICGLMPDKKIGSLYQNKIQFKIEKKSLPKKQKNEPKQIELNKVVNESCIDFLENLSKEYPEGVFDLAFADPPYNLAKDYSTYKDDQEDAKYLKWCNQWIDGMYNNLRPGGTLLILNIPKWSINHFAHLCEKMNFHNWIVWDALSTPAGKLMPSHYSLLYFTKPGGENCVNYEFESEIEKREYCLRTSCIKSRKYNDTNRKESLSDIWKDVHRIKHKKDRDHHPCQLPTKLMERVIKLFSKEGGIVFDPFGGAGTTAIAAKLLNRNFIITELDPHYVTIAENNLKKIKKDIIGQLYYERDSVSQKKIVGVSKKKVENIYLNYCKEKRKVFTPEELLILNPELQQLLKSYTGSVQKLISIAKRTIEAEQLLLIK